VFFSTLIALIGPNPSLWKALDGFLSQERIAAESLKNDLMEVSIFISSLHKLYIVYFVYRNSLHF
jgi:hypothetical protein